MSSLVDLRGYRAGKLFVLGRARSAVRSDGKTQVVWSCKCDCGIIKDISSKLLLTGDVVSCGCHRTFNNKARAIKNRLADHGSAKNHVFSYYRRNAKRRGIEFNLTFEFLIRTVQKPCIYCGDSETNEAKKHSDRWKYTGIDRVDSSKGYSEDNCVPCCVRCNMSKGSKSPEEFKMWAKRLYENLFNR